MNGYKVCVYRLTDNEAATERYNRENAEQIYEQKVAQLPIDDLIAVVNGLPFRERIVVTQGPHPDFQKFDCHFDGQITNCDKDCATLGYCKRRT